MCTSVRFVSYSCKAKQSEEKTNTHWERVKKKHAQNKCEQNETKLNIYNISSFWWMVAHLVHNTFATRQNSFHHGFLLQLRRNSERLYILRWIPHFHSSKIKQNSNYMKMYLHCSDFFIVRDAGIHHAISCRSSTAFHFRKCTRILRFYIIISSILFVCRGICLHFRDVHESFLFCLLFVFCLFRQSKTKKISISHWNTLCSELFFRMAWVAWVVYKK